MSNSSLGLAFGHSLPNVTTTSSQRGFIGNSAGFATAQNMLGSQNISMINTITNNNKFYMSPIEQIRFANDEKYFDLQYHKNRASGEYIGQRKNNMRHGYGQMWYENGDYYAGNWQENQPQGQGLIIFNSQQNQLNSKLTYSGSFDKGYFHGLGKLFYAFSAHQGNFVYVGNWKNGKKEGYGKQFYNDDKYYYLGNWHNDMKNGQGRLVFDTNDYQGKWSNDKMHGQGVLVCRSGSLKTVTIGIWENDQLLSGQISYYDIKVDIDGIRPDSHQQVGLYKGQIRNYLRDGEGCYQIQNLGYSGNFSEDKPMGPGRLKGSIENNEYQLQTNFLSDKVHEANASISYWNKDQFKGKVIIDGMVIKRKQGQYFYSNGAAIQGYFQDNPQGQLRGKYHSIN